MTPPLCVRCGCLLDRVHLDAGQRRHPRCHPDTPDCDTALPRALAVLAAVFPLARRIGAT